MLMAAAGEGEGTNRPLKPNCRVQTRPAKQAGVATVNDSFDVDATAAAFTTSGNVAVGVTGPTNPGLSTRIAIVFTAPGDVADTAGSVIVMVTVVVAPTGMPFNCVAADAAFAMTAVGRVLGETDVTAQEYVSRASQGRPESTMGAGSVTDDVPAGTMISVGTPDPTTGIPYGTVNELPATTAHSKRDINIT